MGAPSKQRTPRPRATAEQIAEATKYVRQANLLRIRGELKQSLAELVKAIEANPYDPEPHLLSAEMLRNVGRPDDAIAAYERAIELSEGQARDVAEAKRARLIMEQEELNSPAASIVNDDVQVIARGNAIVGWSVLAPGLGHWLSGDHTRAIVYWVLLGISFVWMFEASVVVGRGTPFSMRMAPIMAPAFVVWLVSLIDACVAARRTATN